MFNKKFLLCVLALLLITTPFLTACKTGEETSDSASTVSGNTNAFPLEKEVFDKTIKILCVQTERHKYGELQFAPNEELEGDVINEAVKIRNNYIKETYGITIEVVPCEYPGEEIKTTVEAGLDEYQIVADAINRMLPNATANYYCSLQDDLKLGSSWWDQSAIENLSITDKTYFVAGDALLTDDDHTYLILYNKGMYAEDSGLANTYGDLYDMVNDGKWTYDKMYEMAKVIAKPDANGQIATSDGTYGLLGEGYGAGILVEGSGICSAEKTSDGGIELKVDSEQSVNAFEKVFNMMADKSTTYRVEQYGYETGGWGMINNMFIGGQGLFYLGTTAAIGSIRDSELEDKVDFGVLPIPKYSEEQDNYYNGINVYQSTVMAIPTTNVEKKDATLYLMEALGYYSKYPVDNGDSVTSAYYETTLKLKSGVSEDDEKMLDIVFNNRLYDIGAIYNWGGNLISIYSATMKSGSNTLVSSFEAIQNGAQTAMEKTIEEYQNLIT